MESVFAHYAASDSLYTAMVNPVCSKHGLTYMEFTVLMFLANNPQFDTASDIVNYRHLTKSHVSISIRSLEEKGLLKGEHHKPNRRTIHLAVQDSANTIISDGRAAQSEFGKILFSGFSDFEYDRLISFMNRIDENILNYIKLMQKKQG